MESAILQINSINPLKLLKNEVETVQQFVKDYVATANNRLSKENLTPSEITDFLEHFQLGVRLINAVFDIKPAPAKLALTLIKKSALMKCSALMQERLNLIINHSLSH